MRSWERMFRTFTNIRFKKLITGNFLETSSEDRKPKVICFLMEIFFVPKEETVTMFSIYLAQWRDFLPCVKFS